MFCDSDMGSNAEPGNKRRSQLGYIVMWGMVPIVWSSKVTSVRVGFTLDALPAGFPSTLPPRPVTAHPELKAEHVATSSAEAEIYSLALFTNEILSLSYAVQEAGFTFPRPAVVQVDNQAAIAFSRQAGHWRSFQASPHRPQARVGTFPSRKRTCDMRSRLDSE